MTGASCVKPRGEHEGCPPGGGGERGPGVWQHLEVPQMMQPEVALGVCGRLGGGYSAQVPYPEDIPLVIMMNVAPVTWPLCLPNSTEGQTDRGWLLTPGHLIQAAPVAISLSLIRGSFQPDAGPEKGRRNVHSSRWLWLASWRK